MGGRNKIKDDMYEMIKGIEQESEEVPLKATSIKIQVPDCPYECCGGTMEYTGYKRSYGKTGELKRHEHVCAVCGEQEYYYGQYPKVVFEWEEGSYSVCVSDKVIKTGLSNRSYYDGLLTPKEQVEFERIEEDFKEE